MKESYSLSSSGDNSSIFSCGGKSNGTLEGGAAIASCCPGGAIAGGGNAGGGNAGGGAAGGGAACGGLTTSGPA